MLSVYRFWPRMQFSQTEYYLGFGKGVLTGSGSKLRGICVLQDIFGDGPGV